METFEKGDIFLSGKEGKNIALTLHFVQPFCQARKAKI
jgi:hypothetical protein